MTLTDKLDQAELIRHHHEIDGWVSMLRSTTEFNYDRWVTLARTFAGYAIDAAAILV